MLDNMQIELKEKQNLASSSSSVSNNSSSPISSSNNSSNSPPSPAPISPSIPGKSYRGVHSQDSSEGMKIVLQRGESLKKFGETGSLEKKKLNKSSTYHPRSTHPVNNSASKSLKVNGEPKLPASNGAATSVGPTGTQVKDLLHT